MILLYTDPSGRPHILRLPTVERVREWCDNNGMTARHLAGTAWKAES